jgi:type I restriction enzyme R subunit
MELAASQTAADRARAEAEEHQRSLLSAEEQARKEREDRAVWEQLAAEADTARAAVAAELAQLQAAASAGPSEIQKVVEQSTEAAKSIDLDEMATRAIIDQQLRDSGKQRDLKPGRLYRRPILTQPFQLGVQCSRYGRRLSLV